MTDAVQQAPSDSGRLVVTAGFDADPEALFDWWTQPELLCRWWPQEAQTDARPGGPYHLAWPALGWHLRGGYTTFERGRTLAFTWKWDHDAGDAAKTVALTFEARPSGGTLLTLTHGPYADTPEQQDLRIAHHLAGWKHFLPRLARAVIQDVTL